MNATLISHLLSFAVLGTLIAGTLSVLVQNRSFVRVMQTVLILTTFSGTLASIVFFISGLPELSLNILGVAFRFDSLSAIFSLIIGIAAPLANLYSLAYLKDNHHYHVPSLVFFTSLFIAGMQMVLLAVTPFSFMLAWELMSVSSFFLILADREPSSVKAAILYIAMTHISAMGILAAFFLSGVGFTTDFGAFGTLASSVSLLIPFAFFFFSFGSKAGLVPFHVWLPAAHPQAPSHISALLSGVMLKMAVYAFLRFFFLFKPELPEYFGVIVLGIGLISAIFGVLYAVVERDFKKLLAFSSTENLGIIFAMIGAGMLTVKSFGFGLQNPFFALAVFQSVVHAIFKTGLFLTAGAVVEMVHSKSLESMGGIARKFPCLAGGFLALILAAAALPPFGAFFGEWMFIQNVLTLLAGASTLTKIVFIITIPSIAFVGGVAVYTMVKLFGISMLGMPRSQKIAEVKKVDSLIVLPIAILASLSLLIGIGASVFNRFIGVQTSGSNSEALQKLLEGTGSSTLALYALVIAGISALLFVGRRMFSNMKERESATWNCGHPLTSQMQFSATALSAPLRFFFRSLLLVRKSLTKIQLLESNKWIAKYEFTLEQSSLWNQFFYRPFAKGMFYLSSKAALIQNGVVQFYLSLIFLTLIVVLIVAL